MRRLSQWDSRDGNVSDTLPSEYIQKFVTGETCVIVVGKPVLSDNKSINDLVVVGSTQQIQITQQKQLQFTWEMGSRWGTIVPGRSNGTLALTKMMLRGESLMKALYGYITDEELDALYNKPGNGNFWLNLNSELFNRPTGLGLIMRDLESNQYASYFFQSSYISNHNFAVGSGTLVVGESVNMQFERMLPLPIIGLQ